MSKIVIFLCVVLIASAVDGSGTKYQLKSLQKRLESFFDIEINKVEEKYNSAKAIINENSQKVFADENSVYRKAAEDVYEIINKAINEISKSEMQTLSSHDTKDCQEIVGIITVLADVFLTYVHKCTDSILNDALHNLSNMETMYERLHSGLIDAKYGIADCRYRFNKVEEVDRAILCMETIENETRLLIAESAPAVFTKLDEINNMYPTVITSLARCANGYEDLQTAATDYTNRAKTCYEAKKGV